MNTLYTACDGKINIIEDLSNVIECDKIINKEITKSIMSCIRTGETPIFNNKPLIINKIIM